MEIIVKRYELTPERTHGELYIEGRKFCDTLEDTVRTGEKVYGKTAIPAGRYELRLTYSQRFKRVMPQIMDVPNFSGIRIHSGNTEKDTDGCLLVGHRQGDKVINYMEVMAIIWQTQQELIRRTENQEQRLKAVEAALGIGK